MLRTARSPGRGRLALTHGTADSDSGRGAYSASTSDADVLGARGGGLRRSGSGVRRVQHRLLGNTGLQVSAMGLGTWQLGGEWGKRFSQAEVNELVGRASDLGINLLDTAECYGDHLAESLIGSAIAGHREDWIVGTKFGHRFHADRMTNDWRAGM